MRLVASGLRGNVLKCRQLIRVGDRPDAGRIDEYLAFGYLDEP